MPIYNEAASCEQFHKALTTALAPLPYTSRITYIDDGSVDGTSGILQTIASTNDTITVLSLSRNFGHQAALTAGLDHAAADVIIMMDGDGQHPPSLIPEMLKLYESGFDVVQAQRIDTNQTSYMKRTTAAGFYMLLNRVGELQIGAGVSDFRLVTREVLEALRDVREYHRFIRGIIPWLGFTSAMLPYTPAARIADKSKYTLSKMIRLARDGMFSFSLFPLRMGIFLGALLLCLAVYEILYVLSFYTNGTQHMLAPGWSSVIVLMTLIGGSTMVLLGFIGVYVGMIFQQVKGRPIYVLRSRPRRTSAPAQPASF